MSLGQSSRLLWAAAKRCKMVLIESPMAMSRVMAFSKASKAANAQRQYRLVVFLVVTLGDFHNLATRFKTALCDRVGGQSRAVARQRQAIGFG